MFWVALDDWLRRTFFDSMTTWFHTDYVIFPVLKNIKLLNLVLLLGRFVCEERSLGNMRFCTRFHPQTTTIRTLEFWRIWSLGCVLEIKIVLIFLLYFYQHNKFKCITNILRGFSVEVSKVLENWLCNRFVKVIFFTTNYKFYIKKQKSSHDEFEHTKFFELFLYFEVVDEFTPLLRIALQWEKNQFILFRKSSEMERLFIFRFNNREPIRRQEIWF